MKIRIGKTLMLGMAVFLLIVGCNKKDTADTGQEKKSQNPIVNTVETTEAQKEGKMKKYNEYMELKNVPFTEEWRNSFWEVFMKNFVDEKGNFKKPTDKSIEELIKSEETLNMFNEYTTEIDGVIKQGPKLETIDKEAENLLKSLREEKSVMEEIIGYYKNKEYSNDNFEKGKQLAEKYTKALSTRENSYYLYSKSLEELSLKMGEEIAGKSLSEGKEVTASLIKYVNEINKFSNRAFSKEKLVFTGEELKELKEVHKQMSETYKKLEVIKEEAVNKENLDTQQFNEIRKSSKEALENAEKMITSAEKNLQGEVAVYASKFLNAHSRTVDGYNIISAKK